MSTSPHGTVKDGKGPTLTIGSRYVRKEDDMQTTLNGFACGSAFLALIVGNFAGRFMGFQLYDVASVVVTTRRAGGHILMLPVPMNGDFGLILGSDPSDAVLTGFVLTGFNFGYDGYSQVVSHRSKRNSGVLVSSVIEEVRSAVSSSTDHMGVRLDLQQPLRSSDPTRSDSDRYMWVDLLVFPDYADLLFLRQCWSFCQNGSCDRGSL